MYQEMYNASFADDVFKKYITDLIAIAMCRKDHTALQSNKLNRIVHKMYRDGEVDFYLTQEYRDLDYVVTRHGYTSLADNSKYLLFIDEEVYTFKTLDDLKSNMQIYENNMLT